MQVKYVLSPNIVITMTECVKLKMISPTRNKREWLDRMVEKFSDCVQMGVDRIGLRRMTARQVHYELYHDFRKMGLGAESSRMAVNVTHHILSINKGKRNIPKLRKRNLLGLGGKSYAIKNRDGRWTLRVSIGNRKYLWFPLAVPECHRDKFDRIGGDASIIRKDGEWYVILPHKPEIAPTGCSGDFDVIGVDLGIVNHAVASCGSEAMFFSGKAARSKRERFARARNRWQRKNRNDLVKRSKGKEANWMRQVNHEISKEIVGMAARLENPAIALENLGGIRERCRGTKRFNRMMSGWSFRQLAGFISYKAERIDIPVVMVDPRGTSQSCSRCGTMDKSFRKSQNRFVCGECGLDIHADLNASRNITVAGLKVLQQEPPDTARDGVLRPGWAKPS